MTFRVGDEVAIRGDLRINRGQCVYTPDQLVDGKYLKHTGHGGIWTGEIEKIDGDMALVGGGWRGFETLEIPPSSPELDAHLKSIRLAKSIAAKKLDFTILLVRSDNEYSGTVMGVTERHTVLSLGRKALIIANIDLDRPIVKGQDVTLTYANGKATVKENKNIEIER